MRRRRLAEVHLAGRAPGFERDLDARVGEPIVREVRRVLVEHAIDLEGGNRSREVRHLHGIGVSRDGRRDFPDTIGLAERRRFALGSDGHLFDLVRFDRKHLLAVLAAAWRAF